MANCPPTNVKFLLRRDTATNWYSKNPVLQSGEPGYDLTNGILKIGDGVTPWRNLISLGNGGGASGTGGTGPTGPTGPTGAIGPTGPTNSIIFDGGDPSSDYTSGPVFDCGVVT